MPPANSPSETPLRRESAGQLDGLAELAAPVPDLASTLMSQAEEEANDHNVSFLRSAAITPDAEEEYVGSDNLQQARILRQMDSIISIQQRQIQSERESARRLRRAVLRGGMSTSVALQHESHAEARAILDTGTSPREGSRRSIDYQGWAPGTMGEDVDEASLTFNELRALARGHTRPPHDTATRRHYRETESRLAGSTFGNRTVAEPEEMDWQTSGATHYDPRTADPSLRTTALLQSVRRHARFSSPRSWQPPDPSELHTRAIQSTRERERTTNAIPIPRVLPSSRRGIDPPRRDTYNAHNELHRVRARDEPSPSETSVLEEAIQYLERLQSCESESERLSLAKGLTLLVMNEHPPVSDPNDLLIDPSRINAPQASSWLRAGAVFNGSQRSESSTTHAFPSIQLSHPSNSLSRRSHTRSSSIQNNNTTNPYITRSTPSSNQYSSNRSWLHTSAYPLLDDTWPVKVTITSIDHANMTLTGTMEAFNVPNKTAPHAESTIATYLEGEIIDFNRFTLRTKKWDTKVHTDSAYWRQLEPFKGLSDCELAKSVVSKKWLNEELAGRYLLMRWKEKCFITPSDAQVHLTISGFYYISLRRADGHVEGLYFDPNSSPYQHLHLGPSHCDFPSFSFK